MEITNTKIQSDLETKNISKKSNISLNFKGGSNPLISTLQFCENNQIVGVVGIDTVSTNIPRTILDYKTAGLAGALETFRREFSGTLIDCLMLPPLAMCIGIASVFAFFKGDTAKKMMFLGANQDSISFLADKYKESLNSKPRMKNIDHIKLYVENIFNNLEGFDCDKYVKFSDKISSDQMNNLIKKIVDSINKDKLSRQDYKKLIEEVYNPIVKATKASETLKIGDKIVPTNLNDLIKNCVDVGRIFKDKNIAGSVDNVDNFVKKATSYINFKSVGAFLIILPIAMFAQAINRAITRAQFKKSGAPIYKDFETSDQNLYQDMSEKEKKSFFTQKIASAIGMVGLGALSMDKIPSLKMLQSSGLLQTMDQSRLISVVTFTSRLFSAEDPNELRETFVRDVVSFTGLYFLGNYIEKGTATIIEKCKKDTKLLNRIDPIKNEDNIFKKIGKWVKGTKVKTFDEVSSNDKKWKAVCQIANIGFSVLVLGVLLPAYNRYITEKKVKEKEQQLKQRANEMANNIKCCDKINT